MKKPTLYPKKKGQVACVGKNVLLVSVSVSARTQKHLPPHYSTSCHARDVNIPERRQPGDVHSNPYTQRPLHGR